MRTSLNCHRSPICSWTNVSWSITSPVWYVLIFQSNIESSPKQVYVSPDNSMMCLLEQLLASMILEIWNWQHQARKFWSYTSFQVRPSVSPTNDWLSIYSLIKVSTSIIWRHHIPHPHHPQSASSSCEVRVTWWAPIANHDLVLSRRFLHAALDTTYYHNTEVYLICTKPSVL